MTNTFRFSKVRDVKTPTRGTSRSAGIDFYVPNDANPIMLYPGDDTLIPSGIKGNIPEGYMLIGVDKSGIATSNIAKRLAGINAEGEKPSLIVGAKLVDEDYQGEIHIHIINVGRSQVLIKPGMKISQFVLVPVLYADIQEVPEEELYSVTTDRSNGGFGHTGVN